MAMNPGASKRQKELARKERKREKIAKRERRKQEKLERSLEPVAPGVDPDLVGIVPGPPAPAAESPEG
jgi:hypothetical protein